MASTSSVRQVLNAAVKAAARRGVYACPGCASTYPISRITRPCSAKHQLEIVLFGVLGWINSSYERRRWLRCGSCDCEFRCRISKLVLGVLWMLVLAAGVVVPFVWLFPGAVGPSEVGFTGLVEANPAATVVALLWIIVVVPLGIRLLLRRRLRIESGPGEGAETFDAPGAGQPFRDR